MLYRIRDVNFLAINSCFFERFVHDFSGWSDKRFALLILVIARLFADQHDGRLFWTFTKDSLRGTLVEMTRRTFARRIAQLGQT